jgi:hypothetical protein
MIAVLGGLPDVERGLMRTRTARAKDAGRKWAGLLRSPPRRSRGAGGRVTPKAS